MPSSFARLVIASRFWNFDLNSQSSIHVVYMVCTSEPAGAQRSQKINKKATKKIAMREWCKSTDIHSILYLVWAKEFVCVCVCRGHSKESRFACARANIYLPLMSWDCKNNNNKITDPNSLSVLVDWFGSI